jgi:hypothetical protein
MTMSGQLHALAALPPSNGHWYLLVGGWVGLRAGLDSLEEQRRKFSYGNCGEGYKHGKH